MSDKPGIDHLTLDYYEFFCTLPLIGTGKGGALNDQELKIYNEGFALVKKCQEAVLNGLRLPPNAIQRKRELDRDVEDDDRIIAALEAQEQQHEKELEVIRTRKQKLITRRAKRMIESINDIERMVENEKKHIKSYWS